MIHEEIRVRAAYLLLSCAQAVDHFIDQLTADLPPADLPPKPALDRSFRRELGLLFRYWTTRQIWEQLESSEADAKQLNLALLRLFTEEFKLPKDGSGLRYAELLSLQEEACELSHRLANALELDYQPLLAALQELILSWRDLVARHTADSLRLPLDQLALRIKELLARTAGAEP